jgi:hypothetical protein
VVADRGLREAVLAGQSRRLDEARRAEAGVRLLSALQPVLGS